MDTLKIFHDASHGFMELDCTSCNGGAPVKLRFGLYPEPHSVIQNLYNLLSFSNEFSITDAISAYFFEDLSKYLITKEEWSYDYPYYVKYLPQKTFDITAEKAAQIYERVDCLFNHCDNEYSFKYLTNTCTDFIQQIYELAGFKGSHFDEIHSRGIPFTMVGLYGSYSKIRDSISEGLECVSSEVQAIQEHLSDIVGQVALTIHDVTA